MQTNETSRLQNEGSKIPIVQVSTIKEYTARITSIYNDNFRSITQMARNIGIMKNLGRNYKKIVIVFLWKKQATDFGWERCKYIGCVITQDSVRVSG